MAACGHRSGIRWIEASTNEFDWRWTVRALRSHGLVPQWLRHFNLALVDKVYTISRRFSGVRAVGTRHCQAQAGGAPS
jgi:hypothetical protein